MLKKYEIRVYEIECDECGKKTYMQKNRTLYPDKEHITSQGRKVLFFRWNCEEVKVDEFGPLVAEGESFVPDGWYCPEPYPGEHAKIENTLCPECARNGEVVYREQEEAKVKAWLSKGEKNDG